VVADNARTQYKSRDLTVPGTWQTNRKAGSTLMDTMVINNRDEFAKWAIERANAIIVEQGSALATAALSGNEVQLSAAANTLGQTIVDTLLDAFDCLDDSD
tara:strand:- start:12 stop:314 length:303 start_codon:yes stop_codon:yes gene_type:complete